MNEVTEQGNTFRMKRGLLKIHEERQAPSFEYWRTVILDVHDLKLQNMKELHSITYVGHLEFVRTLEVVKKPFFWKRMAQEAEMCPNGNGSQWEQLF